MKERPRLTPLEAFNRIPNTDKLGYGYSLTRKKKTRAQEGKKDKSEDTKNTPKFDVVKKDQFGRVLSLEKRGVNTKAKLSAPVPPGHTKESGFNNINVDEDTEDETFVGGQEYDEYDEYDEDKLTKEQRAALNETLRSLAKTAALSAGIALMPTKDGKHSEVEGYEGVKTENTIQVVPEVREKISEFLEPKVNKNVELNNTGSEEAKKVVADQNSVTEIKELFEKVAETEKTIEALDAFAREVAAYKEAIDPADFKEMMRFAERAVVGAEEYKRIQYVREAIEFKKWDENIGTDVPEAAVEELKRLMPGLCAKESRFKARSISKAKAVGIFQTLPDIWEYYGGKPEEYLSLVKHVEIAGKHISDIYKWVKNGIGEDLLASLRSKYKDEDSFQRDLMVPLVLNAYIAGPTRIVEAVGLYLEKTKAEDIPTGKELFVAIADFAHASEEGDYLSGYGDDSRQYVPELVAFAQKIAEEEKEI